MFVIQLLMCLRLRENVLNAIGERGGLVVNTSDSGSRGRRVRAPLGSCLVQSLSKAHLLPQSTGNTQEAVFSLDVKNQSIN